MIKILLGTLLLLVFLISIPGAFQNTADYKVFRKVLAEELDGIDKICDSNCTNYPADWVLPGYELEAENHCLRQCANRGEMKKILTNDLRATFFYRSEYHWTVGVAYCLMGLNCLEPVK